MTGPRRRPGRTARWGTALLTASIIGACSSSDGVARDESGRITKAGSVSVFELRRGDCLPLSDDAAPEVDSVEAVPCDDPHAREVFAVVDYDGGGGGDGGGAFPGAEALANFADAACADRFADYVGVDYLDSTLFITYLLPNLEGWDKGPDRSVVCLTTTTGSALTGSVEGSGR